MTDTYPQETMGTTLLDVREGDEYRRVFLHRRENMLEVGEFTRGTLTQIAYDAPVHYHCIHVPDTEVERSSAAAFFCKGERYLSDYMDVLDKRAVPYGYLSSTAGSHVSYRPARPEARRKNPAL